VVAVSVVLAALIDYATDPNAPMDTEIDPSDACRGVAG
jgi:hypothetical protein